MEHFSKNHFLYFKLDAKGNVLESNDTFQTLIGELNWLDQNIKTLPVSLLVNESKDNTLDARFSKHNLEFSCSRIENENSEIIVGYSKSKEDEYERKIEDLEIVSNLNMQKLHKINELLEETAEVKQQFLSKVSHELRTPLTGIFGYADMLKLNSPPQQHKSIDSILSNARLLANYVDDLLLFTKNKNAELVIVEKTFVSKELIDQIQDLVDISLTSSQNQDVNFRIIDQTKSENWIGDQVRIFQVVNNLLTNSFKFTPKGNITLTLLEDVAKGALEIKVQDDGIGIPLEEQDTIFDEFIQSSDSINKTGLGLGLSIVRSIVNSMGGRISLESNVGSDSGTTFSVQIPIKPAQEASLLLNTKLTLQKVLYIEDSRTNQEIFKGYLQDTDIQVEVFSEMDEILLERIRNSEFDVILTDLSLGETDGSNIVKAVRTFDPLIPIIVVSGDNKIKTKLAVHKIGADEFVVKPYGKELLKETLALVDPSNWKINLGSFVSQTSQSESNQWQLIEISLEEILVQSKHLISMSKEVTFDSKQNITDYLHKTKTAFSIIENSLLNDKLLKLGSITKQEVYGEEQHFECIMFIYQMMNNVSRFQYSLSHSILKSN